VQALLPSILWALRQVCGSHQRSSPQVVGAVAAGEAHDVGAATIAIARQKALLRLAVVLADLFGGQDETYVKIV